MYGYGFFCRRNGLKFTLVWINHQVTNIINLKLLTLYDKRLIEYKKDPIIRSIKNKSSRKLSIFL